MVRFIFMGDSITDCNRNREDFIPYGLGTCYAFLTSTKLSTMHPEKEIEFLNRGISGNRITDLVARWKRDVINLKPDMLTILIGVNDTWHEADRLEGVSVGQYEKLYRMLIEWTLQELPDLKIALLEPFTLDVGAVGEWDDKYKKEIPVRAAVVKKIAADFGLLFVPLQEKILSAAKACGAEKILRDGVHPAILGHAIISDSVVDAVNGWFE